MAERIPATINDLLAHQGAVGTHSILEIARISAKSSFGAISPFPPSKLARCFGTDTPNHLEVEQAYESGAIDSFTSKRWQGVYVVVYRDGSRTEIFFAGCSGD